MKCIFKQIQWELTKNIVPRNLCAIWKLNKEWPLKKDSVTFLRFLKLLKLKKNSITALRLLKFLINKFLILKKGLRLFLTALKDFNFEKGLHHNLMTLKVCQNSYSVECWWTVASEGRASCDYINKLDHPWVTNFIALVEIHFLFGTKFSSNEGIDTCFNVECVLLDRNFGFLCGYLVITARFIV